MGDVYTNPPQSRNEAILRATIDGTEYTAPPQSRIEDLLLELKEAIEQGGTGEGDMKKSVYDSDDAVATAGGIAAYVDDEITDLHLGTASTKNSTSVVTESSDLVESGAVYDALGFGNKNLFNKNDVENGIINESGAIAIIGEWKSSKFIKVTPSEKYIISGLNISYASSSGFAFYNSAKTFVSGEGINVFKNTPITIPNNVEYIRFSLVPADLDTAQLEVGSTATAYEPYHASVEESKADNSVIGTVENGTTASQAYAVGSHAIRNGAFITWKNAKAQGETINDVSDYDSGDVASCLIKQATFSGTISANGNLWLLTNSNIVIVAVKTSSGLIANIYDNASNSWFLHFRNPTSAGDIPPEGTEVSGTYYYYNI